MMIVTACTDAGIQLGAIYETKNIKSDDKSLGTHLVLLLSANK